MALLEKELSQLEAMAQPTDGIDQYQAAEQLRYNLGSRDIQTQSALPNWGDRYEWGKADDWGKKKILYRAGYPESMQVNLGGGNWGVKTEFGIKLVDPKGANFNDLKGDIAESLSKARVVAGGAVGGLLGGAIGSFAGGVGAVPGAIIGAGIGAGTTETARQLGGANEGLRNKENLMKFTYKDETGNTKLGGLGEILGETTLALGGEAAGALIGGKLLARANKGGNVVDNTLAKSALVKEKFGNYIGTNDYFGGKVLEGSVDILDDAAAAERYVQRGAQGITQMFENTQPRLNEIYKAGMGKIGLKESDKVFNATNALTGIDTTLAEIVNKNKGGIYDNLLTSIKGVRDNMASDIAQNGKLSLTDMESYGTALRSIAEKESTTGLPNQITRLATKPVKAFEIAKQEFTSSLDPVRRAIWQETNAAYKAGKEAGSVLNNLGGIKLAAGEAIDSRAPLSQKLLRFGNQMQSENLVKIEKAVKTLESLGVKSVDEAGNPFDAMKILNTGLANKQIYKETIPSTGVAITKPIKTLGSFVEKMTFSKPNKAKMFVGILKNSPEITEETVGRVFPQANTLLKLLAKGQTKNIRSSIAAAPVKVAGAIVRASNTKAGRQVVARGAVRSLNSILYGDQNSN